MRRMASGSARRRLNRWPSWSRPGVGSGSAASTDALASAMAATGNEAIRRANGRPWASRSAGRDDLVDPTPRRGGVGVDVAAAEHDLHGAAAADEVGEPLGPAAAGQDAERDLGLAEHCGVGGEAHVERGGQLGAAAAGDAGDLGDGRLGHHPEPVDQLVEEVQLGRLASPWSRGRSRISADVGVGDPEVGIGRLDHDDPDVVVVGEPAGRAGRTRTSGRGRTG